MEEMKISYSFGVMDLFHYGHLKALQEAAKDADLHIVGLVSDKASRGWLGNIVSNEEERKAVLESISCVSWVMPQETLDPTDNLKKLHDLYPEAIITLFRGDDITVIQARQYLSAIGGKVKSLTYYDRLSPMDILNALNSRGETPERYAGIISTKANTLAALKERLIFSAIEDILIISTDELKNDPNRITNEIKMYFDGKTVVVRSSCLAEDNFETSNAGHFESVLNVDSNNEEAVLNALNIVYRSYLVDGSDIADEQILVQSQTKDVICSGVVFTRDIQRNRPYYVINYDESGSTDTVTSGSGGKTIWIAQNAGEESIPEKWISLWRAIRELERILNGVLLDVEFAIKADNSVVIFQVRPLATNYKFGRNISIAHQIECKDFIKEQYRKFISGHPVSHFSDMAFWNPAEIIGDSPKNLDYSLYREIITHRAWNQGLVPLGYRCVPDDLMYRFGNKPYICLEHSFKSLTPATISEELADKLCNFYLKKLADDWSSHDKIEFEIVFNCFDFNLQEKLADLVSEGLFTTDETAEIESELLQLTENMVCNYKTILAEDLAALTRLEENRLMIENMVDADREKLVVAIKNLLNEISEFGTPQFSRQARCAFVAKALVLSLKDRGYWDVKTYEEFNTSIETIATKFERDFSSFLSKGISKKEFDLSYGHLRAGTYDITSPRYDSIDFAEVVLENYLEKNSAPKCMMESTKKDCLVGIERAISDYGMSLDQNTLFDFMRNSLAQREYFKFVFTKSLSTVIEMVAKLGAELGYDRETMSYFDINEIAGFQVYNNAEGIREYIEELYPLRKEKFEKFSQIMMPNVISGESDFDFVTSIDSRPNFITVKSVEGELVVLKGYVESDISGKIVAIEKADPGYDWIFTRGIRGLITKYGGVASHMAIRCAEFEIPAAIGCGEKIFDYVFRRENEIVKLDCGKGVIQ